MIIAARRAYEPYPRANKETQIDPAACCIGATSDTDSRNCSARYVLSAPLGAILARDPRGVSALLASGLHSTSAARRVAGYRRSRQGPLVSRFFRSAEVGLPVGARGPTDSVHTEGRLFSRGTLPVFERTTSITITITATTTGTTTTVDAASRRHTFAARRVRARTRARVECSRV